MSRLQQSPRDTSISRSRRNQIPNPTHPAYQISPDFPPNKVSSWYGDNENSRVWTLMHKSVVNEAHRLLKTLKSIQLRTSSLQLWEVDILKVAAVIHFDHLRTCLNHEENYIFPCMKTRIDMGSALPDRVPLIIEANQASMEFEHLVETGSVQQVTLLMRGYVTTLAHHMKETLDTCLPLFRSYFTPDEARSLMMKATGKQTKNAKGAFIYYMGGDSAQFLRDRRVPWVVQLLVFRPAVNFYKKNFIEPLKTVDDNKEPSYFVSRKRLQSKTPSLTKDMPKKRKIYQNSRSSPNDPSPKQKHTIRNLEQQTAEKLG